MNRVPATVETYLPVNQVAAEFSVSRRTVLRMVEAGKIPAYKIGRVVRIPRSCVEKYLSEHRLPVKTDGETVPT